MIAIDKVVKKSKAKVESIATFSTAIVFFLKPSLKLKIDLEYLLLRPKYFSVSIPLKESIKLLDKT